MAPLLIKEGVLISLQSCSACVLLAGNAQPLPTTQQSSHTEKRMHHDHGLAFAKECASMKVLEFGPCALCRTRATPVVNVPSIQVEFAAQQFTPPPCSPSRSVARRTVV